MNGLLPGFAELCVMASKAMRPYLPQISVAISATCFAIYGGDVHEWIKGCVKGYHFLLRLLAFVFLAAFGYGALSLALAHFLGLLLTAMSDVLLAPALVVALVAIGILAEEKNHI